jgi:hypothetical protein
MSNPLLGPLLAFASKLRFRTLFLVTAGLFALDLVIPDVLPFVDEILLGLATLLLSALRKPVQRPPENP